MKSLFALVQARARELLWPEVRWDVFISYAWADASEYANKLAHRLESAGTASWLDRRQIAAGNNVARSILYGIRRSRVLVVILSPEALHSKWMRDEFSRFAPRRSVVLLALGIEEKEAFALWPSLSGLPLLSASADGSDIDEIVAALVSIVKDRQPAEIEDDQFSSVALGRVARWALGTTSRLLEQGPGGENADHIKSFELGFRFEYDNCRGDKAAIVRLVVRNLTDALVFAHPCLGSLPADVQRYLAEGLRWMGGPAWVIPTAAFAVWTGVPASVAVAAAIKTLFAISASRAVWLWLRDIRATSAARKVATTPPPK